MRAVLPAHNLTQREADVAIRVTRDALPENLIGRELGLLEFGVYGEKKYVGAYSKGKGMIPLHWVGEDNNDARPRWLPDFIEPLHLIIRTNEVLATYDAIQHAGMMFVRRFFLERKNDGAL